jgi:hypothetical protein
MGIVYHNFGLAGPGKTIRGRPYFLDSPLVFRSLGHSASLHSHAHSRHIWAARNPTGFFIAPLKRRKQPERYAPLLSEHLGRNKGGGIHAAVNHILYKNKY